MLMSGLLAHRDVRTVICRNNIRLSLLALMLALAGCSVPDEKSSTTLSTEVVKTDTPVSEAMMTVPGPFLDAADLNWKVNEFDAARWKTLVGGIEGGQIDRQDIQFGVWELAPLAIYHRHRHEVPEIYFITAGRARWTVGEETREVSAGMTIYTKPGAIHKMVNLTDKPLQAICV